MLKYITLTIVVRCLSTAMKNCAELYKSGKRMTGVYTIDPDGLGAFDVFCDQKSVGGGGQYSRRDSMASLISTIAAGRTSDVDSET